jgi:hypothetical protein
MKNSIFVKNPRESYINIEHSNITMKEKGKNLLTRLKKTKPLSMNEQLLNRVVEEINLTNTESDGRVVSKGKININSARSGDKFNNNSSASTSRSKAKNNSISISTTSSIPKKTNTHTKINIPKATSVSKTTKLSKNPSNGLETYPNTTGVILDTHATNSRPLKTEISATSIADTAQLHNNSFYNSSFSNNYFGKNSFSGRDNHSGGIGNSQSFKFETFKFNEEILEMKLQNSKLKNELNINKEKVKTLKQIIQMKNSENDLIKGKYQEMIDEYKKEIEKVKKNNIDAGMLKLQNNKLQHYLKSTVGMFVDIVEIFLTQHSIGIGNKTKQSILVDNNSYSIDIYDSYTDNEDRKGLIMDQIQALLLSKLAFMKKNLNMEGVTFEKELEKIKNWPQIFQNSDKNQYLNTPQNNLSNLRLSLNKGNDLDYKDFKDKDTHTVSSNSNDFFELSVSNPHIILSPKFNRGDNIFSNLISKQSKEMTGDNVNNNTITMEQGVKGEDNQNLILNDSFLKELKQSKHFIYEINYIIIDDSFSEFKSNNSNNIFSANKGSVAFFGGGEVSFIDLDGRNVGNDGNDPNDPDPNDVKEIDSLPKTPITDDDVNEFEGFGRLESGMYADEVVNISFNQN